MGRTRYIGDSPFDGDARDNDPRFVSALAKGLLVLQAFTPKDQWLAHRELVIRTGLPASTVSRLAFTLHQLGFLRHEQSQGAYSLAPPVLALGFSVLGRSDVVHIARPFMQELAHKCEATVSLGVRHGLEVIYVGHCRGTDRLYLGLDIGSRLPIDKTAMGRSIVYSLEEREQLGITAALLAKGASCDSLKIDSVNSQIEEFGYVLSESEWEPGISAAAAPLDLRDGVNVYGMSVGGLSTRLTPEFLRNVAGPALAKTCSELLQVIHEAKWADRNELL
jgi:DNA-binding IclR family transcriptional regulator